MCAAGLLLIAGAGFSFVSQSKNDLISQNAELFEVREPIYNADFNETKPEAKEIKIIEVEEVAEAEAKPEEIKNSRAANINLKELNLKYEDLEADFNFPPVKKASVNNNKLNNNKRVNNNNVNNNSDYWIKINKGSYTLALYKGDELVKEYSVAVGKNPGDKQRKGDHRTPVGDFKIVSIEDASNWKHDFGDGKGKIAGAYGPWFLRLDAGGWKGIGIHGTHDPDSLGTMASEGCIRMENSEIQELKNFAYRTMRVLIQE
ncbi:MAG: L,D-transpeptidase [Synergistaceae bacterium]|nr:L,D-transpeptidase [Synergistaceae bacterium]